MSKFGRVNHVIVQIERVFLVIMWTSKTLSILVPIRSYFRGQIVVKVIIETLGFQFLFLVIKILTDVNWGLTDIFMCRKN